MPARWALRHYAIPLLSSRAIAAATGRDGIPWFGAGEMDLRQLGYFVRVVELGSLTRAATVLRIAQPALGIQIKKLEVEFGAPLLVRHSRGVEPTDVGALLFEQAKALLTSADAIKNRINDYTGPPRGHVSLGVPPIVHSVPIEVIERCRAEYPEVSLTIVEEFSSFLVEWIEDGRLDMACAYVDSIPRDMRGERLLREDFLFVGAPGMMGDNTSDISFDEMVKHPLILPGKENSLRRLLHDAALRNGVSLDVPLQVRSQPLVNELVERSFGYTILPYMAARLKMQQGRFVARRIVNPVVSTELRLIYRERRTFSKAESAVRDIVISAFKDEITRSIASGSSFLRY